MSGCSRARYSTRRGMRARMPLMLKVTSFMTPPLAALGQTEKLDPQPQPEAALGLVTLNAAPPRSST